MSDVAIALVVIIVVAVVTVVIAVLIRLYGIYHLTSCFASSEEKAVLTQHEQYNGYMVRNLNYSLSTNISKAFESFSMYH